jgi:hypothetical protein
MNQDRDIGQIVIEIVEVLEVHHCLMAFVLLWVVGCRCIVGDVRDYYHARDFESFGPRVVFSGSCCYDEIGAGEMAYREAVETTGQFGLGGVSLDVFLCDTVSWWS